MQRFLFGFLLISQGLFAQVPQRIPYQGIARNAAGQPLTNTTIAIRLHVRDAVSGGNTLYTETKSVGTTASGLYSLVIHDGAGMVTGDWNAINWAAGARFLKTEIDPANGNSFLDFGTVELQSVPYAFVTDQVVNQRLGGLKDVSASAPAVGDILQWNGTAWTNAAKTASGVTAAGFSGHIQSIAGNNSVYVFAGPAATVTVSGPNQVLVGSAEAVLGFQAGASPGAVRIGICYQRIDIPNQPVTNFVGPDYTTHRVVSERRTYPASGHVTGLPAGMYKIGVGVLNSTSAILADVDFVNGYVLVL